MNAVAKKLTKVAASSITRTPEDQALVEAYARTVSTSVPPHFRQKPENKGTRILEPDSEDHALWVARQGQATGLPSMDLANRLVGQLLNLDPRESDDVAAAANAIVDGLGAIGPRDAVEAFLAAQMLATHQAVMDVYRRGLVPEQTFEARNMYLKHAAKLSRLYTDQMLALAKYRNRGKQTVRVEHVTVNGNAIVGTVQPRGEGDIENGG